MPQSSAPGPLLCSTLTGFLTIHVHAFKCQLLSSSQASASSLNCQFLSPAVCSITWLITIALISHPSSSQLLSMPSFQLLGKNAWSHPQILCLTSHTSSLSGSPISDIFLEIYPETGHFSPPLPRPPSTPGCSCLEAYNSLLTGSFASTLCPLVNSQLSSQKGCF